MRFRIGLMLLVVAALALALFPSVAERMMTIEMLGWHLEMRQGLFFALVVLLALALWLLVRLVRLLAAGPRRMVDAWRAGGRRRREVRLIDALTSWVNGVPVEGGRVRDAAAGLVPPWLAEALAVLVDPAADPREDEQPLIIALRGRQMAQPEGEARLSLAVRRAVVERWLARFPRALPARLQALRLAEEAGDWSAVVALIEQAPRGVELPDGARRKGRALLRLAEREERPPLSLLQQAVRLDDSDEAVLALAAAHRQGDDLKSARGVLLDALDRRDSMTIARALAAQEAAFDNPLLVLHMLEKRCRKQANVAQRWLLVELARQAEDRERMQHHLRQLKRSAEGARLAWALEAEQHMEAGEWESAARCYRQACADAGVGERP